ncbi:MAG: peptidoglycan DD-metalloendopeptidase family protein [Candidatus Eisenbacteria bacterium]|nr:peptidoglycan DD-metalloendopeptidase family protein [Candidatus Eisenbacteria bacterium]
MPWFTGGVAGFLVLVLLRLQGVVLPPPSEPASDVSALSDPRTYTDADTVHRGDTLAGLLLRNRMDLQQIDFVLKEIRQNGYFSPRALLPGQVFEFTRDEGGRVEKLTCKVSPEKIFVFRIHPDSLGSFAQAVDSEVRIRKMAGTVQSTFEEAVIAAGGDVRLAIKLAEVLSCDVDFFTEVRRGDRFSLLVEERYVEGSKVGYGELLYGWYRGEQAQATCCYFEPQDGGGKGGYYDSQGHSLRKAFLKSPLNYRRISSTFSKGRFHPILKKVRPHHGVDYAAAEGTPVVAVADGVVAFAGWRGGYGRYIKIEHGRSHETAYGHLRSFAKGIRAGSRVHQGDKIGYVGRTGLATGPHLHFEMVENGRLIDPLRMKTLPSEPIPASRLPEFRDLVQRMSSADLRLASGEVLEPQAWAEMMAQNTAPQTQTASTP